MCNYKENKWETIWTVMIWTLESNRLCIKTRRLCDHPLSGIVILYGISYNKIQSKHRDKKGKPCSVLISRYLWWLKSYLLQFGYRLSLQFFTRMQLVSNSIFSDKSNFSMPQHRSTHTNLRTRLCLHLPISFDNVLFAFVKCFNEIKFVLWLWFILQIDIILWILKSCQDFCRSAFHSTNVYGEHCNMLMNFEWSLTLDANGRFA